MNKLNHIQKMQTGRRIAYLKRCLFASELLQQLETTSSVRIRVFELHIQPILRCSYTTFNNMLNERNPTQQIAELETRLNQQEE